MNEEIKYLLFQETPEGGYYSFTSKLISTERFVKYLNSKYSPGIVNPMTKVMGDWHALVGYTGRYLHTLFISTEHRGNNIISITANESTKNELEFYNFDLSLYCILCNRIRTIQGGHLDFFYLHPYASKNVKERTSLDYVGISIVPPDISDIRATSKANEFYADIIPLYEQLIAEQKI